MGHTKHFSHKANWDQLDGEPEICEFKRLTSFQSSCNKTIFEKTIITLTIVYPSIWYNITSSTFASLLFVFIELFNGTPQAAARTSPDYLPAPGRTTRPLDSAALRGFPRRSPS